MPCQLMGLIQQNGRTSTRFASYASAGVCKTDRGLRGPFESLNRKNTCVIHFQQGHCAMYGAAKQEAWAD